LYFPWLAIKAARRRDIALHLRLMACTAIIPLETFSGKSCYQSLDLRALISLLQEDV